MRVCAVLLVGLFGGGVGGVFFPLNSSYGCNSPDLKSF